MIIGITGTLGAGKDTVAEHLEKLGFVHFSLSDAIRDECDKRGLSKDRDTLTNLANELRANEGHDTLAKRIAEKMKTWEDKNFVITSIRNEKEAEYLKSLSNFILLAVDAPIELRYKRISARQRESDTVSFERFKEQENREINGGEGKQNLGPLMQMADYTIQNTGTVDELHEKIKKTLKI